jgi:hypothetical protein
MRYLQKSLHLNSSQRPTCVRKPNPITHNWVQLINGTINELTKDYNSSIERLVVHWIDYPSFQYCYSSIDKIPTSLTMKNKGVGRS